MELFDNFTPRQLMALEALVECRWNRAAAARKLGIGRSAMLKLYRRIDITFSSPPDEPPPGSIGRLARHVYREWRKRLR